MGIIIAKFRSKKSTFEVLEKLENEISSIEEFSRATENTKKRIVGRFIGLGICTYVFLAIGLYFYYHKISPNQKLVYILPLVAFPVVIFGVKTFLSWYYSRKIKKNQLKLVKLKEEKKKILEKVEETETYKVAKKILDKFGESNKEPLITAIGNTAIKPKLSNTEIPSSKSTLPDLRQRIVGNPSAKVRLSFGSQLGTPVARTPVLPFRTAAGYSVTPNKAANVQSISSALQLPRAILPKNRTILDKMFDYLVGDGPSNRYALICKRCSSHNGMAFKEEFEYLSFECCYCGFFNPALKKRPSGPKLETTISHSKTLSESSDSDVSSNESNRGSLKPTNIEENSNNNQFGAHPVEIQDCGDSPASHIDTSENQEAESVNPFESNGYPSGDGRNPFGDDSEPELENFPTEALAPDAGSPQMLEHEKD